MLALINIDDYIDFYLDRPTLLFISLRLIFLKFENKGLHVPSDVCYTTHLLAAEESDDGDEVAGDAYQHEEDAAGGSEAQEGSRVALE